jgi:hypothetical protein
MAFVKAMHEYTAGCGECQVDAGDGRQIYVQGRWVHRPWIGHRNTRSSQNVTVCATDVDVNVVFNVPPEYVPPV